MEKEDVYHLRRAMEDMDVKNDETVEKEKAKAKAKDTTPLVKTPDTEDEDEVRLHEAALNEAAELVWRHEHGYKPPAPGTPYRYRPHLRKNSYAHMRTASIGPHAEEVAATGLGRNISHSASGSSTGSSRRNSSEHPGRPSLESNGSRKLRLPASHVAAAKNRTRSGLKRNVSGNVEPAFSGDQIWEEPEVRETKIAAQKKLNLTREQKCQNSQMQDSSRDEKKTTGSEKTVLQDSPKGPLNKLSSRSLAQSSVRRSLPWLSNRNKGLEKTEIHRNPPSQSRNPGYTTNIPIDKKSSDDDTTPKKNGIEVRSDDIIQATSKRLKDRSARLPTPSAVSDSPGRPIVSFDANWKAPEEETDVKIENARSGSTSLAPKGRQSEAAIASVVVGSSDEAVGRISAPSSQLSSVQMDGNRFSGSGNMSNAGAAFSHDSFSIPPAATLSTVARSIRTSTPPTETGASRPLSQIEVPANKSNIDPAKTPAQPLPPVPSIVLSVGGNHNSPSKPDFQRLPQISVSEEEDNKSSKSCSSVPIIVTPDDDIKAAPNVPQISVSGGDASTSTNRPSVPGVPKIIAPDDKPRPSDGSRPLPTPSKSPSLVGARQPRGHWSPAPARNSKSSAKCHECQLSIEGRFIALGGVGERFHPECFRCFACGTSLEALEISPEPVERRAERMDRICRRARGEILPEEEGKTAAEDGDERLRFFCHLDWHELYAPRCKHCTTPILGEHIVALGNHWHYGHFFCAECGDPFEQGMTHIEKDGYAWCVKCQTKRTERRAPKCKRCKRAVIGQYIRALGGEWHDECFRCATCHGGFDDGQVFPFLEASGADMKVLCTKCRQIELKA